MLDSDKGQDAEERSRDTKSFVRRVRSVTRRKYIARSGPSTTCSGGESTIRLKGPGRVGRSLGPPESEPRRAWQDLIWGTAAMDKVDPGRVEKVFPLSSQRPWSADYCVNGLVRSRAPRIAHPRRAASAYMFSGLVECYRCARALSGRDSKSGRLHYYVCQSLLKRGN